jgi:26S proteasome regulatory subunit (ATPase 3-interacting protein)
MLKLNLFKTVLLCRYTLTSKLTRILILADLTKLKASPTDAMLSECISNTEAQITKSLEQLEPLRESRQLVSTEDTSQLDADWVTWRAQWVTRKKLFRE